MRKHVYSAVFTALAAALSAGVVFLPGAFVLFSLISTVLFTFAVVLADTAKSRAVSQGIVALFYIATVFVLKNPVPGLLLLATFFPVGLAVGTAFGMRKNLNSAGAMSVLFGSVFVLLTFVVYAVYSTMPDISFSAAAESIREAFVPQVESVLEAAVGAQAELNDGMYLYSISTIADAVFSYIPAAIAVWFLFSSAVSFAVLRTAQKSASNDVSFMGDFSGFRVSKAGAIVYFIASVIALFTLGTPVGTAAMNFTGVMSVVLSYAGISLVSFFLEFKNISNVLRRIIIVLLFVIAVFPIGFSYLLSILGLVDAYINIREKLMNSGH